MLKFLLLMPVAMLLTACPVSQEFPLGIKGEYPFDNRLIGVWSNGQESVEASQVEIKAQNDGKSAQLNVLERGSLYTPETNLFEAWLTIIKDETFLVLKEMPTEPAEKESYFLYHLTIEENLVTTRDVGLLVGGSDAVTSTETFREEVKQSLEIDDCLSSPIEWYKE